VDESLLNYVIPIALRFVAGHLMKFAATRARVVHWFPACFGFQVPFTGASGAKMPGEAEPDSKVADECAKLLMISQQTIWVFRV